MGEDLIGIMLVGPRTLKLSSKARAALLKKMEARKAFAAKLLVDPDSKIPSGMHVMSILEDEEVLNRIAEGDCASILSEFMNVWNQSYSRDSVSRLHGKNRIVFAGAPSWGDEPDGYGYETLRDAIKFPELLKVLKIE